MAEQKKVAGAASASATLGMDKEFMAAFGPSGQTCKVELGNLTPQDCLFLGGLVRLFADPKNREALEGFRKGESALLWATDLAGALMVRTGPVFGEN